eukprot:5777577-Amphidinium_carterae.1
MLSVTYFSIGENSFTGVLPEIGLREVTEFRIHQNRFAGALPDGGMRAMLSVTHFSIGRNRLLSFTGLRTVVSLIDTFFAGTVAESRPLHACNPWQVGTITGIEPQKSFEVPFRSPRTLPAALSRLRHASTLRLSHNYFEGSI